MKLRDRILQIINKTESVIPCEPVPDLPPKDFPGIPEYHSFENDVWSYGEEIRPLLTKHPELRVDTEIQERILKICLNKNAKRGRQSFIMLIGNLKFSNYAQEISTQINDPFVSGHVISTLTKMKKAGFYREVSPFLESKITWVRKEAKKYCDIYNGL